MSTYRRQPWHACLGLCSCVVVSASLRFPSMACCLTFCIACGTMTAQCWQRALTIQCAWDANTGCSVELPTWQPIWHSESLDVVCGQVMLLVTVCLCNLSRVDTFLPNCDCSPTCVYPDMSCFKLAVFCLSRGHQACSRCQHSLVATDWHDIPC